MFLLQQTNLIVLSVSYIFVLTLISLTNPYLYRVNLLVYWTKNISEFIKNKSYIPTHQHQ